MTTKIISLAIGCFLSSYLSLLLGCANAPTTYEPQSTASAARPLPHEPAERSAAAAVPPFKKVVLVIFENDDFSVAMKQDFFQKLGEWGTVLTNFSALTHPSQPNYV